MKLHKIHSLIKAGVAFAQAKQIENVNKWCNPAATYWARDPV
jgi:hypothetical protein